MAEAVDPPFDKPDRDFNSLEGWTWVGTYGGYYLQCDLLQGFEHGFFTRQWQGRGPEVLAGYVSAGVSVHRPQQVHGNRVLAASQAACQPWPEADGGSTYMAPAQLVGDFLARRPSRCAQGVQPSYQPGVRYGDLDSCLPPFVLEAIREALPIFARRIPGYAMEGALLTGVETRTSSPVRLPRDQTTLECTNTPGLFPAGEGAGYAGGILSAAIDGIKVAEQVALSITHPHLQRLGAQGESACDPI